MEIDLVAKYDLMVVRGFLDESTCQNIIEQTRRGSSSPATVYGRTNSGLVEEHVRKAARLNPSDENLRLVNQRLLDHKQMVEQHFQISLRDLEQPQFLRYGVSDFFVAHQDGNTGLIRLDTETDRKISVVIFLNQQTTERKSGDYCGGALRFSDYRAKPGQREFDLPSEPGMLVAFRPEVTHEVTPVVHGERFSIASWYR